MRKNLNIQRFDTTLTFSKNVGVNKSLKAY